MSRWGKNIVVPLDALCKEKENTNRPTVTRSVGTVGKWGKMGFTSTRTYSLAALPASLAIASPSESPSSVLDDDMSLSVPDPPKPKKFFKSINTTPPEIIAQIIQQLPRVAASPIREPSSFAHSNDSQMHVTSPQAKANALKIKIARNSSVERKKKLPPKLIKSFKSSEEQTSDGSDTPSNCEIKLQKKKKDDKKLKPEAQPSRIIARTRKTVNYCEDDDEERTPTPVKDIILPKNKIRNEEKSDSKLEPTVGSPVCTTGSSTLKTLEHRPIVLRISKVSFQIKPKLNIIHLKMQAKTNTSLRIMPRLIH